MAVTFTTLVHHAERGLRRLLPGLNDVPVAKAWGGPIDISADRLPFFKTMSGTRVHYACGYSGHGVNPTYIGGHMAMGFATDDRKLLQHSVATIAARYRKAGNFKTKYWTPEMHGAAFALPRFVAEPHTNGVRLAVSDQRITHSYTVEDRCRVFRNLGRSEVARSIHGHLHDC